ncbi:MAG: DUF4340 domain-containing protein [Flavobacteriales bacterium]|nr:DUF4340 domain-containing protein [Flavobacteriales bacterium]
MKKNLIGLLVLLALGAAAYYVYVQRGSGTMKPALHDFAVDDTSAVTRIFLADKYGRKVTLDRVSDVEWTLNGTHKARKDMMDVLLKTIYRVEMKAPVAESAHNNIVALMAGKSVRTEIYKGDKLVKVYYVGDATNDNMGTYMLLEGSGSPFICHIPGFVGYLTSRYVTDELTWRDTEVFADRIHEIAELEIDYHLFPEKSFRIKRAKGGVFSMETMHPGPKAIADFDTVEVMRYLMGYDNVRFEKVQGYPQVTVDSIVNSQWYYRIKLTESSGRVRSITTYRILFDPADLELQAEALDWDPDQMHAVIDGNEKEVVLAQYFVFDRLTVDYGQFLKRSGRNP